MSPRKPENRSQLPEPTGAELDLLQVLWKQGPCTVRQVHDVLQRDNPVAYTTVLSILQIMFQKGLVTRDDSERAHVYAAALSQQQAQRRFVSKLVQQIFGGSSTELIMQALGSGKPANPDEIARIRSRLDELQGRDK